ncbi:MAG: acyl carrier protein [Paludibacteraceae bacterium]|nr:acyl carrier protein [Paludibacteraceae bacterium]
MEQTILTIINSIRIAQELTPVTELHTTDNLREDLELTSFDLAELTVRIEDKYGIDIFEDGLVNTIGEIYNKLQQ